MNAEFLREAVLVVMGITAVATLMFPALYSRFPWRSSRVGRALMAKAASTALAVNVVFGLVFLAPPREIRYIILLICFSLISAANVYVTYVMMDLNSHVQSTDDRAIKTKRGTKVIKSNKLYDVLKFLAQIVLPTIATLYLTLAGLWDLPEPTKVSATIMAIDSALGIMLGLSSNTYYKSGADTDGAINVIDTPERTAFQLSIDTSPEKLATQERVVLKVTNTPPAVEVDPNVVDSDGMRPYQTPKADRL